MLFGLIAFILIIGWLLRMYFNSKFNYWKSKGIAGPTPIIIFGNTISIFRRPMPVVELEWYRKYGKIYGVYNGTTKALTISDPQHIKQVLVKDFYSFRNRSISPYKGDDILEKVIFFLRDSKWKRVRTLLSPVFTSSKIRSMFALMNESSDQFVRSLDNFAKNSTEINLKQIMGAYTIDLTAKCVFNINVNTVKDGNNVFSRHAFGFLYAKIWKVLLVFAFPQIFRKTIRALILTSVESGQYFIDVGRSILAKRRELPAYPKDFIQLLIDSEKDDRKDVNKYDDCAQHFSSIANELIDEKVSKNIGDTLSENEALAQCFLFLIAGYESASSTLSFFFYEMALHTEIQDNLYKEIKSAFSNDAIDYETLLKLTYLDAVFSEILRIHGTLRIERQAMDDIVLGDTGITITKGTVVEIPVYAIHHDPQYFEDPFVFNPNRFLPENSKNIAPFTYLPFGAGPRFCIAMRFAIVELKLAIAKIILKYRFSQSDNTEVPLRYVKGVRLLQAERISVRIDRR